MATLELYINRVEGGQHTFRKVVGLRRQDVSFTSTCIDEMLAQAVQLLESDADFKEDERMRIYDIGRRLVAGGDGNAWVTLKQLRLWTAPGGMKEPQANEDILGKRAGMAAAA